VGGGVSVLRVVLVNPAHVCQGSGVGRDLSLVLGLMQSLAYSGDLPFAGGHFGEGQ